MPRRKAANGAGSALWLEKKQLWEVRFTTTDSDGLTIRKAVYAKTQREAIAKAKALEEQYRKGLVAKRDARTFEAYAAEWLGRKERSGRARNTTKGYADDIKKAKAHLGPLKLQAVKPSHIRKLLDSLAQTHGYRTLEHVLRTVRGIFNEALTDELVFRNPAAHIRLEAPRGEPKAKSLQPHEVTMVLEACPGAEMGLFFRLLLGCGLRKGEALGLTWADLSLERAEVTISKNWTGVGRGHLSEKPKTRAGRRMVPVPTGLLERFRAHRAELLKDWTPKQLEACYIFGPVGSGRPFEVNAPNHALRRLVDRVNAAQAKREKDSEGAILEGSLPRLPRLRVHDLRHTYGSIALSRGIPLEVVSERMGHANPTITLNIYRHVLEHERRGYLFDVEELVRQPHPSGPSQSPQDPQLAAAPRAQA
ncbi:MAG: site-specific integrase [Meiothermus sp.]|nr:site-specific integrase [Meiothermus sp.]